MLIQAGCDMEIKDDRNDFTPLLWAVLLNRPSIVKDLIDAGADVNSVGHLTPDLYRKININEEKAVRALALAYKIQSLEIMQLLVDNGARFDLLEPSLLQSIQVAATCQNFFLATPEIQSLLKANVFKHVSLDVYLSELEPETGRLFVDAVPDDARVRVLSIGSEYRTGMELMPGIHYIEVSKDGFQTTSETFSITAGNDLNVTIVLEKKFVPEFVRRNDAGIQKKDGHYTLYENDIVYDESTGLEWVAGPDEDTHWNDAKNWAENLPLAGGGWRMPTKEELKGLYEKNKGSRNMTPLLKTTGWYVWSGETRDSSSGGPFGINSIPLGISSYPLGVNFTYGDEFWPDVYFNDSYERGFAVRSRRR
jgi:hypothetical protein